MFFNYIKLLRVDHWFKNLFIIAGIISAILFIQSKFTGPQVVVQTIGAFILASLISSVNYIVNQIADVAFDKRHPDKKTRPIPSGKISIFRAEILAIILLLGSLIIANVFYNANFFYVLLSLWIAGILYNIRPIRLKNIPYIDVISESFNNPVRFLIGWFVVVKSEFPSVLILLATWSIGAVLMTAKRYDELKFYGKKLVPYRNTFNTYSLKSLLIMMYFYIALSTIFITSEIYKYQRSFLIGIPFMLLFLLWIVEKVKSGEAKTRNVESFIFSYRFILYSFILLLFFVFLYLYS